MNVLSYHVFDGRQWLSDDEHTWTADYNSAAHFTNAKLAQDIGERESGPDRTIYVMACLGWQG
jgi:hypothetical protein